MQSDIEIARAAQLEPVLAIGERLGIPADALVPHGHDKAKIRLDYLDWLAARPDGKLVLVTAMSPTPAGEGKTTVSIGLADGLNRIGRQATVCLREPMPDIAESAAVDGFVNTFNATHNIKQVFAEVAGYCTSHL